MRGVGLYRVTQDIDALAQLEVEGQSGAGMVKVQMTCKYDVKRVSIDPSLVGDDKEMLEDLVAAAFNDAARFSSSGWTCCCPAGAAEVAAAGAGATSVRAGTAC